MKPTREHFVVFLSPGTLFSETSERLIEDWDIKKAVALSGEIVVRHGARPFGFYFVTQLVAPWSPSATLRPIKRSGTHFIGSRLVTLDEVETRNRPDEAALRYNMRCNDYPIVAVTTSNYQSTLPFENYQSTLPFEEEDLVIDAGGEIVERGNDPKYVEYRKKTIARIRALNR